VTPIRAIRQAWARASFATVIPVAAFLMGALLSILFTAYYFGSAYETFKVDTKAQKEQLARALAGDLADNDIVEIHAELAIFAPMRARVLDAEGNVIAGQVDPKFERLVREYPIQI
jgi:hypothetical protein